MVNFIEEGDKFLADVKIKEPGAIWIISSLQIQVDNLTLGFLITNVVGVLLPFFLDLLFHRI